MLTVDITTQANQIDDNRLIAGSHPNLNLSLRAYEKLAQPGWQVYATVLTVRGSARSRKIPYITEALMASDGVFGTVKHGQHTSLAKISKELAKVSLSSDQHLRLNQRFPFSQGWPGVSTQRKSRPDRPTPSFCEAVPGSTGISLYGNREYWVTDLQGRQRLVCDRHLFRPSGSRKGKTSKPLDLV